jgi:hypothetical protein
MLRDAEKITQLGEKLLGEKGPHACNCRSRPDMMTTDQLLFGTVKKLKQQSHKQTSSEEVLHFDEHVRNAYN